MAKLNDWNQQRQKAHLWLYQRIAFEKRQENQIIIKKVPGVSLTAKALIISMDSRPFRFKIVFEIDFKFLYQQNIRRQGGQKRRWQNI